MRKYGYEGTITFSLGSSGRIYRHGRTGRHALGGTEYEWSRREVARQRGNRKVASMVRRDVLKLQQPPRRTIRGDDGDIVRDF